MEDVTPVTVVDWQMSRNIAAFVGAEKQECWKNASLALLASGPKDAWNTYRYVEGVCCSIITFEHGWLEKPDGTVVDPTLVLTKAPTDPVAYFPVDRYTLEELDDLWDKARYGVLEFPIKRGPALWRDPGFAAANRAALIYSGVPKEWVDKYSQKDTD